MGRQIIHVVLVRWAASAVPDVVARLERGERGGAALGEGGSNLAWRRLRQG